MTRIQLISLGFVLLVACGELSRTPGAADAGAASDGGLESLRTRCTECRTGPNQCLNNECVASCDRLKPYPCPFGFHCWDGTCVPEVLPSCGESPCNADQQCVSTYCLGASPRGCDPAGSDCSSDEACLGEPPACLVLPPCNLDETCRPGTLGAVCNRERNRASLDPRQAPGICLLGHCTSNDHCPAPLTCQEIGAEVEGLGVCR